MMIMTQQKKVFMNKSEPLVHLDRYKEARRRQIVLEAFRAMGASKTQMMVEQIRCLSPEYVDTWIDCIDIETSEPIEEENNEPEDLSWVLTLSIVYSFS